MSPSRLDVIARGLDNAFYISTSTSPGVWSGWSTLGGVFNSGPAVVSRSLNRLDVFGRGTDNKLYGRSFTTTNGWSSSWVAISADTFVSDLSVAVSDVNQIDVVAKKADNLVYISTRNTAGLWSSFVRFPGVRGRGRHLPVWMDLRFLLGAQIGGTYSRLGRATLSFIKRGTGGPGRHGWALELALSTAPRLQLLGLMDGST